MIAFFYSQYLFVAILLTSFVSACVPHPQVPIPSLQYGKMDASVNKNLIILLRGRGGSNRDFEKHGLLDRIRSSGQGFDIVCPDAHFGYYRSQTLTQRLKYDIIDPARKAGYEKIWLAGFSMGGLGSLFYLRDYSSDIDGVILVSPFVGWSEFIDWIRAAGGVGEWMPDKSQPDDWQQIVWGWLKTFHENPRQYPPIYLGYAIGDTVVEGGPELLSTLLPPERVATIEGGHDYPTFKKLWDLMLDSIFRQ